MALQDVNTVDLVARPLRGEAYEDEWSHYRDLVGKLKGCPAWVQTSDLRRAHPHVRPGEIRVRVLCASPPSEAMAHVQSVGSPASSAIAACPRRSLSYASGKPLGVPQIAAPSARDAPAGTARSYSSRKP